MMTTIDLTKIRGDFITIDSRYSMKESPDDDYITLTVVVDGSGDGFNIHIKNALPSNTGIVDELCEHVYLPLIKAINAGELSSVSVKFIDDHVEVTAKIEAYIFKAVLNKRKHKAWGCDQINSMLSVLGPYQSSMTANHSIEVSLLGQNNDSKPTVIIRAGLSAGVGIIPLTLDRYDLVEWVSKKFKCEIPDTISIGQGSRNGFIPPIFVIERQLDHQLHITSQYNTHTIVITESAQIAKTNLTFGETTPKFIWAVTPEFFGSGGSNKLISAFEAINRAVGGKLNKVVLSYDSAIRPYINNSNYEFIIAVIKKLGCDGLTSAINSFIIVCSDVQTGGDYVSRNTFMKMISSILVNSTNLKDIQDLTKNIVVKNKDNESSSILSSIIGIGELFKYAEGKHLDKEAPTLKVKLAPKITRNINSWFGS